MDFCKARGVTAGCLFCQQPLAKSQGVTEPGLEAPLERVTALRLIRQAHQPAQGPSHWNWRWKAGDNCIRRASRQTACGQTWSSLAVGTLVPRPPYINAWIPSASLREWLQSSIFTRTLLKITLRKTYFYFINPTGLIAHGSPSSRLNFFILYPVNFAK